MRKKVLAVCMFDSIHSARWLSQFKDQEIDFLLFPSSPHRKVHKNLSELVNRNSKATYRLVAGGRWFALPLWMADKFVKNFFRGNLLTAAIRNFEPDVLHAMELQNAGYISLRALRRGKPAALRLISTNWGSDIYWFRRFPKHEAKLRELLALSDAYSCECERDVALAKQLGFSGRVMPVIPNAGGFPEELLSAPAPKLEDRKTIAVKGYHGWVGRAKNALVAIEQLGDKLNDFVIEIYSANATTVRLARQIMRRTSLQIKIHPKGSLNHSEVLDLFSRSRLYVGLSLSDGISTSLLEAMAMGAIPVQTSSACCDEWFSESGVAVPDVEIETVKTAILRGLELAENQALADRNRETIVEKANYELVSSIAQAFYKD